MYQVDSGGRLWSVTATELKKQKGYLPWEEQDVALSHICHFLVFQGNRALEEDIWEPILAAWLRPWQGKGRADVNSHSASHRVSGEEIAGRRQPTQQCRLIFLFHLANSLSVADEKVPDNAGRSGPR